MPSIVTFVPSIPPDVILTSFATNPPFNFSFVISIFKLSINFLYPSGAFVSVIVISSLLVISVIFTVPKSIVPFAVVTVFVSVLPGNFQLNSAPSNLVVLFWLSIFSNFNW